MKVLHLGLCVNPHGFSSFPHAFKKVLGESNYRELQCSSDTAFNPNAIAIFNEFKPDVVFMQIQAENIIHAQTCEYFLNHGSKVINWTGDKRHVIPNWMIDIAPFVSLTAFSNMDDVKMMRQMGYKSEYLEIGFDEEIYTPQGEVYPIQDIVFFANNYGVGHFPMSEYRIKLVQFLRNNYGDKFGVYGSGWSDGNGNANHSQHVEAKYLRGAKIVINCSHFNSERYNSDRLLRTLGTGAFCLSAKHNGMEQDYTHQEHLAYFNTFEELRHRIDFYLDNEHERKRIAENGRNLVLNRNTFVHQVENIIKLAE